MKKFSWLLFFLSIYGCSAHSQSIMGIEPTVKYGRIFKHTKNFLPDIEHSSYAFDLNLTWQTTGTRDWQRLHCYPWLGVAAGYVEYGNKLVLGSAVYLVPNINLPLATGKHLQLYFKMGVGVAYLTKHYDVITNPTNIVIASSINNCTSFGFRGRYKVNDHLHIFAGGSFTHFSTGDVRLPNLGINIPTFDIGIHYTFKPVDEKTFNHNAVAAPNRHLQFDAKLGLGYNSFAAPNGPEYPIYIGELSVGKLAGKWNKFSLGTQVDFNNATYYFIINQQLDKGKEGRSATNYSAFLQDEMLFGNFAITLQMAYYVKRTLLSGAPLHQKLGTHYYFLHFGKDKHMGLSLGVCLTTHFFNADYVSTELGFAF